jgi:hypothetical protein
MKTCKHTSVGEMLACYFFILCIIVRLLFYQFSLFLHMIPMPIIIFTHTYEVNMPNKIDEVKYC